jgi:AraC-like DNA-binding protein
MTDPRGLRGGWASFQEHQTLEPSPELTPYVERYWAVRWDLTGQPPYRQPIVPYPNVQLSFGAGGPSGTDGEAWARVCGPVRGPVSRVLEGSGWVFGVAFRPGCFRPVLGRPVSTLTDRWVPAAEIFGTGVPVEPMAAAPGPPARRAVVEQFLRTALPPPDPEADAVADMVALLAVSPEISRVGELATRLGTHPRRLQRLFADHVGIGPKLVIRRYRLHQVTLRIAATPTVDWARLAAELGYADQAHLCRDFGALAGEPPTRHAERYPAAMAPSQRPQPGPRTAAGRRLSARV